MNETLNRALALYDLQPTKIFPVQKGYRNKTYRIQTADQDLNLIFYKDEPGILERIKRSDAISEHAHGKNLPVRHLADPRILTLKSPTRTTYARLYHYLPGRTIAWEMYTMKHIKLLGWAMSDLHSAIQDAPVELPLATTEILDQLQYISEYFADPGVQSAIAKKLHLQIPLSIFPALRETIISVGALPAQPLHLDLVRGNILFDHASNLRPKTPVDLLQLRRTPRALVLETCDDRFEEWRQVDQGGSSATWQLSSLQISGLIDFEKTAIGSPLFDLARTYAFLLADCANKSPKQIYKYLIYSGYNKRGASPIRIPQKLFHSLVNFYLLFDFYKFLEHNPYESLSENHHFRRTAAILIHRKVITSTKCDTPRQMC